MGENTGFIKPDEEIKHVNHGKARCGDHTGLKPAMEASVSVVWNASGDVAVRVVAQRVAKNNTRLKPGVEIIAVRRSGSTINN